MNTYRHDKDFLSAHLPLIELSRGESRLLCTGALQGRVLTTSLGGEEGASLGFINYPLISSGCTLPHCNNWGGEERFWLGPEGGQNSLFFAPETPFDFEHWQTPAIIDTAPWHVMRSDNTSAEFESDATLTNHRGTVLVCHLHRRVRLLATSEAEEVKAVAYETENTLKNAGHEAWNEQTGMPSIWMLGQFNPGDNTKIIIPLRADARAEVNQTYFGRIGSERLHIAQGYLVFTADGRQRGKLGLPPELSLGRAAAYDAEAGVLTVLSFRQPTAPAVYVNSMWEWQKEPFKGDVINAYNDGPLDDGSIMGPFFELESSSPAARLAPEQSITHRQRTAHYQGPLEALEPIAARELGLSLKACLGL